MSVLKGEKPSIETLELALGEFKKKGIVENVRCERCNSLIEITENGPSVLQVKCDCGMYNDNIRGL
jgi:phage FluMu protein Com